MTLHLLSSPCLPDSERWRCSLIVRFHDERFGIPEFHGSPAFGDLAAASYDDFANTTPACIRRSPVTAPALRVRVRDRCAIPHRTRPQLLPSATIGRNQHSGSRSGFHASVGSVRTGIQTVLPELAGRNPDRAAARP